MRSFHTLTVGRSSCALLALLLAVGVVADEAQFNVLLELREGDGSLLGSVDGLRGVLLVLGVALEEVLVGALATTDTLESVLSAEVELLSWPKTSTSTSRIVLLAMARG